jgi:hypothetical protein
MQASKSFSMPEYSYMLTTTPRADIESVIDHLGEPAIVLPADAEPMAVRLDLAGPVPQFTMHPAYSSILSHLSPPAAAIAVDFLALVTFLDQETKRFQLLDPFVLDDCVINLQHRFVRCDDDSLTPLDQAFRATCLIFLKCLSRPLNVVSVTTTPLAVRLGRHLATITVTPRPLLIWFLYMGMIAGDPLCLDRIWMASQLVDELRTAEGAILPWQNVKEQLREIAWVDAVLDEIGEKIWMEIETLALV